MSYINRYLKNIKPYKTASHKVWTVEASERQNILKLDWNEATIPPSPKVAEKIKELISNPDFYNLYPSTENHTLLRLLSDYIELPVENIQYFSSSDAIHEYISKMYIGNGETIVIQAPSYDNFRLTAEISGAKIFFSEINEDFSFSSEKFENDLDKINPCFVYICNPNNPIGYLHPTLYIKHLLDKYPDIMFLIDEAYSEFAGESSKELVLEHNNILITRTMSKAFAMANFRFGYLISSIENIDHITKIRNPKNISTFTQEAAIGVLSDIPYMRAYVEEVEQAKTYFVTELQKYNNFLTVYPGSANFIAIKCATKEIKKELIKHLLDNNVFVRELSQSPILNTTIRITIGTLPQMKKVSGFIDEFLKSKENLCQV